MSSMKLAFNAVFPLLAFMVVGAGLRRAGMLDEKTSAGLNKLVFKVFLPLAGIPGRLLYRRQHVNGQFLVHVRASKSSTKTATVCAVH